MTRIDDILQEASKQFSQLSFVDSKSPSGKKALTLYGAKIQTGNERFVVLDNGKIYCTIERLGSGWAAKFGLEELSAIQPSLEACKEMIRQRHQGCLESFIPYSKMDERAQVDFLSQWLKGSLPREEYAMVEMAAVDFGSPGWVIVFNDVRTGGGAQHVILYQIGTKRWRIPFSTGGFDYNSCDDVPSDVFTRAKSFLDKPKVLLYANAYWTMDPSLMRKVFD